MQIPTIQGNNSEAVKSWLQSLQESGLLFHMDDNPEDIVWNTVHPSHQELLNLSTQQDKAWEICEEAVVDIFELYPTTH